MGCADPDVEVPCAQQMGRFLYRMYRNPWFCSLGQLVHLQIVCVWSDDKAGVMDQDGQHAVTRLGRDDDLAGGDAAAAEYLPPR